jgi:hypothetical protein
MLCLSYYLLCFLFTKIGEEEGGTGSAWKRGEWRGEGSREERWPKQMYKQTKKHCLKRINSCVWVLGKEQMFV